LAVTVSKHENDDKAAPTGVEESRSPASLAPQSKINRLLLFLFNTFKKVLRAEGEENKEIDSAAFNKSLLQALDLIQWEVFARDQEFEVNNEGFRFIPTRKDMAKGVDAIISVDFHCEFVRNCWRHLYETGQFAYCSSQTSSEWNDRTTVSDFFLKEYLKRVDKRLRTYRGHWQEQLLKIKDEYPRGQDDLVRTFNKNQKNCLVIEDGELSFFTLLWLLRDAERDGRLSQWRNTKQSNGEPAQRPDPDPWWKFVIIRELGEASGLVGPSVGGKRAFTPRWRSLVKWLDKYQERCADGTARVEDLPVKYLKGRSKEESKFLDNLRDFFSSRKESSDKTAITLKEWVKQARCRTEPNIEHGFLPFVKCLEDYGLLLTDSDGVAVAKTFDSSTRPEDPVLFRVCRAPLLFVEFLLRAYQPGEMHLLVFPLNHTKTLDLDFAPTSLAFATVVRELSETETTEENRYWDGADLNQIYPYWALLTAMAGELSAQGLKSNAEKLGRMAGAVSGATEQAQAWAHEIGNTVSFMDPDLAKENAQVFRWAKNFINFQVMAGTRGLPNDLELWVTFNNSMVWINNAIVLSAQCAVMRERRQNSDSLKDSTFAERCVKEKKEKVRWPYTTNIDEELRFSNAIVNLNPNQRSPVASFAQLLVCGLYNAMYHCDVKDGIRIILQRGYLAVRNVISPKGGGKVSGGTQATLQLAAGFLWEYHQGQSSQGGTRGPDRMPPIFFEKVKVNLLTVTGDTGTFTLTFDDQTTPPLSVNVGASAIQTALSALPRLDDGSVSVSLEGNVFTVAFRDRLAGGNQPRLTANGTGGASVTIATAECNEWLFQVYLPPSLFQAPLPRTSSGST
jgi:hypothetical protein